MDLVICIALKDIIFINKNLFFINKNLAPDNIYVITDKRNNKYITNCYNNITLIDENSLLPNLTFFSVKRAIDDNNYKYRQYGWYFQQFLKLGFALSEFAKKEYLVWDADTVPFNPIIFKQNGKYLLLPKSEYNPDYFDTINRLFDAPNKANFSFISEHMVFNVDIVKEMIDRIVSKSGTARYWFEQCLDVVNPDAGNGFSEFETYGTYCINYHPDIFEVRVLRTFRRCGSIYGIFATRDEIESLKTELDTGSFEAYDFPLAYFRRFKQKTFFYFCKIISRLRIHFINLPI